MSPGRQMASVYRVPTVWIVIGAVFTLSGSAAFVFAVSVGDAQRAWQAYLVNFVYWAGLSFGAVLFSPILNMTNATWGRPMKRLSEAFSAYLPVSFALFWVLYLGRVELFEWVREPVGAGFKHVWLRSWFMFSRNGLGLGLLSLLCLLLVYFSVRADRRWASPRGDGGVPGEPLDGDSPAGWRAQKVLSPIIGITYAFVLSLVAFDMIMSLDPHWYSTLFGGYYFTGSFYTGIVALYLSSLITMNGPALKEYIHPRQLHDMGKLVMAFALFTGYLFYAQFLVIWYANISEETRYMILRFKSAPWGYLGWLVLAMILVIPLLTLLGRKIKARRAAMTALCLIILVGMWLERFILVAPSVWKGSGIPLGFLEALITGGFFGIVVLCVTLFLRVVPAVPVSDPLFHKFLREREERFRP